MLHHGADVEQLTDEIVDRVGSLVKQATLPAADLRAVLGFLTKVALVVDQAFQDVYTLLIDLKYLSQDEATPDRIRDYQKQLDLVMSRSYYRDMEEICSRLGQLKEQFRRQIEPIVSNLPDREEWREVFWLVEDREGYILESVKRTMRELSKMLEGLYDVQALNRKAGQKADTIRLALSKLHALTNRILGLSGEIGLLELTATDRSSMTTGAVSVYCVGGIHMGDDIKARDIIGSAVGRGATATARDITVYTQELDQSGATISAPLRQALIEAREGIDKADIDAALKPMIIENFDKLTNELKKGDAKNSGVASGLWTMVYNVVKGIPTAVGALAALDKLRTLLGY